METEEMESKETTVTDICLFMNELAPVKYAESWDNPGLLLGHLAQHVHKIMVALDLSPEVAEQAIEQECDIIITHHPYLFCLPKTLAVTDTKMEVLYELIKHDIALYAAHTNLDAAKGGVNDVLAARLGLDEVTEIPRKDCPEQGLARIGVLDEPMALKDFAAKVRDDLGAEHLTYAGGDEPVYKVAVVGGSGADIMEAALAEGDIYVTCTGNLRVITGDHILYIYGCYMKERGKLLMNTVVTTVMSNFGLYKAFDEQGIGYAKTAVGDKYVYEYMAKNGCRIGGEQSGHINYSKYASTGDGILTSLKMMEVMLAKKKPMSELAAPLKIYPQVLKNVKVTDKKAAQDDVDVQAAVKAVGEALGDTGRILVRESGTEPLVRVMVEAPEHETCEKYVQQVVDVIKAKGYAI